MPAIQDFPLWLIFLGSLLVLFGANEVGRRLVRANRPAGRLPHLYFGGFGTGAIGADARLYLLHVPVAL
jgi:hypothetical protein